MNSLEELSKELEEKIKKLSVIQKEIGSSAENIYEAIREFVDDQVGLAEKKKQDMIQETENAQQAILTLKNLMGEPISDKIQLNPNNSLQENYNELQLERNKVQEKYNEKLVLIKDLYLQLDDFKNAMEDFVDTSMLETTDIDVSASAVERIEEEIVRCEKEYVRRKETIDESTQLISSYMGLLGIEPELDRDRILISYLYENDPNEKMKLCNMLVSADFMYYIENRLAELDQQKQKIEHQKQELTLQLKQLWQRLHIAPQECEVFLMANRGLSTKDLQKFQDELDKLGVLKKERIGDFIETTREELKVLWDQLFYSEQQRKEFKAYYSTDLTDDILEAHENEISRLQLELEDSKYILEYIEKHMKLKKEVQEFEATTSDPNRLFSKGQRDPGRLLREEKFRKRISRELPKVIKELEGSLLEYEALKGHPFLVNGKPYYDVIYEEQVKATQIKTPKREHPTPKREHPTPIRQPMTSPRATRTRKLFFNTPQVNRTKSFHQVQTIDTKTDTSESILHQVRAKNLRKQKQIKRGHIFDDDSEEEESENMNPTKKRKQPGKNPSASIIGHHSESDDNIALDLGIFDDGPDLSDMSEVEA